MVEKCEIGGGIVLLHCTRLHEAEILFGHFYNSPPTKVGHENGEPKTVILSSTFLVHCLRDDFELLSCSTNSLQFALHMCCGKIFLTLNGCKWLNTFGNTSESPCNGSQVEKSVQNCHF